MKPPGTKRLKLKCGVLLSTSAFKFNLRRYIKVDDEKLVLNSLQCIASIAENKAGASLVHFSAQRKRFLWDRGSL